jgi:hypothetical protein
MATEVMFGKLGANAFGGEVAGDAFMIDYLSDTIKHALLTGTASIDVDADEVFTEIANEVANGNGYTSGGLTATGKTTTYNATGNKTVHDCDDPAWTGSGAGFTARDKTSYRDGATDPLISHLDFGADQTVGVGDTLTIQIDATTGLFFVTAT